MAALAAVVGIGQTRYMTKRGDVSIAGLVREAAVNALRDADLDWDDVEAVIIGKAPDMFEGVVMPEAYLCDALGCNGKPMLRVHTAGSVGGSTALVAASHVQSGTFKRVLTVTFEKQSESNAMWALSTPQPFRTQGPPLSRSHRRQWRLAPPLSPTLPAKLRWNSSPSLCAPRRVRKRSLHLTN